MNLNYVLNNIKTSKTSKSLKFRFKQKDLSPNILYSNDNLSNLSKLIFQFKQKMLKNDSNASSAIDDLSSQLTTELSKRHNEFDNAKQLQYKNTNKSNSRD